MKRWTAKRANDWYKNQPWLVGCNFIPSNAINQLEMWQAATFDPGTIDRELGWAASIGMNCVRVYLHDLAWETDAAGFKARVDRFLTIATRHSIAPLFVFFDDCWLEDPKPGTQPAPKPGVHNSGWLQSPGKAVVNDPAAWPRLERYVKDMLGAFGADKRILGWDLYNEPGNSKQDEKSLSLLKAVFKWAWAVRPSQPLTAGAWYDNAVLAAFQVKASDIVTFHNYSDAASLATQIAALKAHGRPLICTEWLRRGASDVATHLPVFKAAGVGCINWGLVSGKTQTIYPWGSPGGQPEPALWFHDLFRGDGTPFSAAETALFRTLTGRGKHMQ
jgi:hypothetical protein